MFIDTAAELGRELVVDLEKADTEFPWVLFPKSTTLSDYIVRRNGKINGRRVSYFVNGAESQDSLGTHQKDVTRQFKFPLNINMKTWDPSLTIKVPAACDCCDMVAAYTDISLVEEQMVEPGEIIWVGLGNSEIDWLQFLSYKFSLHPKTLILVKDVTENYVEYRIECIGDNWSAMTDPKSSIFMFEHGKTKTTILALSDSYKILPYSMFRRESFSARNTLYRMTENVNFPFLLPLGNAKQWQLLH